MIQERLCFEPHNPAVPNETISCRLEVEGASVCLLVGYQSNGITPRPEAQKWKHPYPSCDRLFLFKKGHADLETRRGKVQLRAGHLHLLPEGYAFNVTYSAGSLLYWFHLRTLDRIYLPFFRGADSILHRDDPTMFDLITEGVDKRNVTLTRTHVFAAIVSFAETQLRTNPNRDLLYDRFRDLFDYLEENLTPYTRIGELASVMNMSTSALSKGFQRAAGLPLKKYLITITMNRAKQRLLMSDMTVEEVAYEIGFKNPYYFNKAFKKHTGFTPGNYRKRSVERED